ncbi:hypothetical protein E2C01_073497 [Portunus trituberculatus]|uniref:Uncharacterized protein n=1 Tax=Portunus trituberculatus TaxID=210409 RepID=A0A5B7IAQ6_PORTR|nr:hypothetical protein [Portunus trituberculatus]
MLTLGILQPFTKVALITSKKVRGRAEKQVWQRRMEGQERGRKRVQVCFIAHPAVYRQDSRPKHPTGSSARPR